MHKDIKYQKFYKIFTKDITIHLLNKHWGKTLYSCMTVKTMKRYFIKTLKFYQIFIIDQENKKMKVRFVIGVSKIKEKV